ncbi:U-box domain-containing protein 62-like [Quillaja saponaria]|uniref:U-box domain-containing protein 62-like n=1 Tax=Quillaja saponaria TaxID=32244 RepID=A0AAD7PLI0_QUISA|nr:U-box domain-containing protein 62-like [Quillaja saponaria]
MSSEEVGLLPSPRIENNLNSRLVFQVDSLRFNCGVPQSRIGDPGPKTRELSSFIDDKMFSVERDRFFSSHQSAEFRRNLYGGCSDRGDPPETRNWNGNGSTTTPSGDDTEGDDDDDDEEEDDEDDEVEGDGEIEGLVGAHDCNKGNSNTVNDINNNGNDSNLNSGADKLSNGKAKLHSSFGSGRGDMGQLVNNNTRKSTNEHHQEERLDNYQNAVTIAETDSDVYYSRYLQGTEGSASLQKDIVVENGCGFGGRKDVYSSDSGESLRAILSDPLTGSLMDDAMILPCGHSFGGGGIQHVIRMKACCTCSQSISEDSISPNLSLRAAVQAFRREEESQFYRSSKRRREKFDQERSSYGDSTLMEPPRGRGVQFPFAVTDRVIIKGNKRTPQRFVGREAIVTTQCLNGWYVVKTLDNAESVKLQYRSLAKV